MDSKHYELRVLPLFERDLNEIIDYISGVLQNPIAAADMVDAVEKAIRERLTCPEAFEPYRSAREREHPYYRIAVKNYVIYYVVIDNIMEVRRILYNRRDIAKEI